MKMRRVRGKFALLAGMGVGMVLLTQTALALEPVGDVTGGGRDWSQTWAVSDGDFDHIQLLMATPGAAFAMPDGVDSLPGNWSQTYNDGTLVIADGDAPTSFLAFVTHFAGASVDPLTFYFQLWNGSDFVSESTVAWDGSGWDIGGGSPWADVRVDAKEPALPTDMRVPPEAQLLLVPDAACYHVGDAVTVAVNMTDAVKVIVSGQYWLAYDPSQLEFVSAEPGGAPFTEEVFEWVDQPAGKLDYSTGVPDLADGTMDDSTLAVITFTALAEACDTANLVTFRAYDPADPHPPTRLSDDFEGGAVYATLWEMPAITIDSTPPEQIGCPGGDPDDPPEVTVECSLLDATWPVFDDLGALLVTASDNCDSEPVVTFDEVRADGLCLDEYDLTRTWTATDVCGNYSECVLIIHVVDTTSPTLQGCPDDVTVECDAVPSAAAVTATDNCDPAPVVTLDEVQSDSTCDDTYTLTRVWTATDACGNSACCAQVITVQDTTPPELSDCPEDVTVSCDAVPLPALVTATDNCATPDVEFEEVQSDHACDDGYTLTRTWTATDDCGNSASCTQIITVQDLEPPVLSGCPSDVTVECDAVPIPAMVTVTDNCDPSPSLVFVEVRTDGACPDSYILTRTWTAEDRCGNAASCEQIITVEDTTAPIIICPLDITVSADVGTCEAILCPGPALADDNCDPGPVITAVRSDLLDSCADPYPVGTTTITWTATDACGNSAICIQSITVEPYNDVLVIIGLDGTVVSPLTRCITFELWECGTPSATVVEADMDFIDGVATGTIQVPCGELGYSCITARDPLHTLRRTLDPLPIEDTQYVADFVAADKPLIGGNLNDDYWIDTLDFGTYVYELGTIYGPTGDTPCGTAGPHADINGSGQAWTEDFGFIAINFLMYHEPNCCSLPGKSFGPMDTPVTRISVRDLYASGQGYLAVADLNGDGVLDTGDIEAFVMEGAPSEKPKSLSP